MSKKKRELYWPFECEHGHKFDLGPIHDPDAWEPHPDEPNTWRSVPGSGREEHVPAEAPCWPCRAEGVRTVARRA